MRYNSVILKDKPTVYHRMSEASGTSATDSSGNSNTGTYSASGITYAQAGAIRGDGNTATTFDGAAGRLLINSGITMNGWTKMTVEVWLNLTNQTTLTSYPQLAGNDFPSSAHKGFFWYPAPTTDTKTFYYEIGDGTNFGTYSFGSGALSASTWYHLVAVYDGSSVTVYKNGLSIGTNSVTATSLGTPTYQTGISQFSGGTGGNIAGKFDEIAIYNAALSSGQVLNHYLTGTCQVTTQHRTSQRGS